MKKKMKINFLGHKRQLLQRYGWLILLFISSSSSFAQTNIDLNKDYKDIKIKKNETQSYKLVLSKGNYYSFQVLQKGIDVIIKLLDNRNKEILTKDSPNGINGLENFVLNAPATGSYTMLIQASDEAENSAEGKYNILVDKFSEFQNEEMKKVKAENAKAIQTLDIDHFWAAFDKLKYCKSHDDSVSCIQSNYIDVATDGMKEFMSVRDFSAEAYIRTIGKMPKFYNSIRPNTYEVKTLVQEINDILYKFNNIYSDFKPFKICFAIGTISTGGTTSKNFLLIGSEVSTSTKNTDVSEFNNNAYSKILQNEVDVKSNVKNMIAHEYVHTQQLFYRDTSCFKLYQCLHEGIADFIGELLVGATINRVAKKYGDEHEKQLWNEFSTRLCEKDTKNWLYNYDFTKDRPADLGYYIGYKIAQAYYNNHQNKKEAIKNTLRFTNAKQYLEESNYNPQ